MRLIFIIVFCLFSLITFSQPEPGTPSEPGKCYAKCLIQDTYRNSNEVIKYPHYSQNNLKSKVTSIQIGPSKRKWVKKKVDKRCLSADPNDCLVWCLVNSPGRFSDYKITYYSSEYRQALLSADSLITYKTIVNIQTIDRVGGFTEWKKVICTDSPEYSDIVTEVQTILKRNSYQIKVIDGELNSETKAALVKFQKDYKLPIGNLDYKTLFRLGIKHEDSDEFASKLLLENTSDPSYECYGIYLLDDEPVFESSSTTVPIYIGSNVKKVNFISQQNPVFRTEYEKKNLIVKEDRKLKRLLEKNPEDIEYITLNYNSKVFGERGIEKRPILCDDRDDYDTILSQVTSKLESLGYSIDSGLTPKTRAALAAYQQKHGLLMGHLDFKTLDHLGITY